jgi:integrase
MSEGIKPERTQKTKARGNGSGSVFYVASASRWRACLTWVDSAGKQHRKSRDRLTQREAQQALLELHREQARWTPGSDMLLRDWLVLWLQAESAHVRPGTLRRYSQVVTNQLVPELGDLTLGGLTARDVEALTDRMALKYAPTTVSVIRSVLGIALRSAHKAGHVTTNVVSLSRPPKVTSPEVLLLSPQQTQTLLAAAKGDQIIGAAVTTLVASGARVGEVLGLRVGDLKGGRLHIERTLLPDGTVGPTKSGRGRRAITLPSWAVDTLEAHIAALRGSGVASGPTDLMFRDELGRPWPQSLFRDRFDKMLKVAKLPHVRIHSLRHQHATSLLDGGADLLSVSRRLGHSSVAFTSDRYVGKLDNRDKDIADRLEALLG